MYWYSRNVFFALDIGMMYGKMYGHHWSWWPNQSFWVWSSWPNVSSAISVIGADVGNGIRVFLPDIGMFMAGLGTWLLCRSLEKKRPVEEMAQYNQDFDAEEQVRLTWTVTAYILHYSIVFTFSHTYSRRYIFIYKQMYMNTEFNRYRLNRFNRFSRHKCISLASVLYSLHQKHILILVQTRLFILHLHLADTFIEGDLQLRWADKD